MTEAIQERGRAGRRSILGAAMERAGGAAEPGQAGTDSASQQAMKKRPRQTGILGAAMARTGVPEPTVGGDPGGPVRAAPQFAPRPVRAGGLRAIPGFHGQARTDDVGINAMLDLKELWEGYKGLGKALFADPAATVKEVAVNFGPAIAQSYTRWYKAWEQGKFLESVEQYPIQFLQDLTAPISLLFTGGASGLGVLGKGSAGAAKAAGAMRKIAGVSNALQIVTDPIGGAAVVGGAKAGGILTAAVVRKLRRELPALPKQKMPIDLKDAPLRSGLGRRMKESADTLITQVIDQTYPIRQLSRRAFGTEEAALEQAVRTLAGTDRKIQRALHGGFFHPKDVLKSTGNKGLKTIIEDTGEAFLADLRDYAVARRASLDLARQGKKHGVNIEAAQQVRREFDPGAAPDVDPHVHERWTELRTFLDDALTYYQEGGMISRELADQWRRQNPNYVPFFRTAERQAGEAGARGASGPGGPKEVVKAFKGSDRMLKDPLESSFVLSARMMREVELNHITGELAQLADLPGSGVVRVEGPAGAAGKVKLGELDGAMEVLGAPGAKGKDAALLLPETPVGRPAGTPDNVLVHFRDGVREYFEVDPDVAQAFAALRFKPDSQITKWLGYPALRPFQWAAQIKRAGITLAPGFTLGLNVPRDMMQAGILSKGRFIPVYDNLRGLFHYLGRGEMFEAWARSGGMQAHLSAFDQKVLRRDFKQWASSKNAGALRKIADTIKHPIQILQAIQEGSEASTRLGEFNAVVRKDLKMQAGETLEAAAARAGQEGVDVGAVLRKGAVSSRDVTVDFGMAGQHPGIKAWNSITAFQNAQLQGHYLTWRKLMEGTPKERALIAAKAALFITIPSLILHARNAEDPEYRDMPQIEKDLFWIDRLPDGTWARWPKPFEFGLYFGTLPVRALESISEGDPTIFTRTADRLLSVDGELQPFSPPSLIVPLAEVAAGRSFFYDTPLVPRGQQRFTKAEQALPSTSEVAKVLSRLDEWISSALPETVPGGVNEPHLSPLEYNHLIYGFTGTAGRTATGVVDYLARGETRPETKGPVAEIGETRVPLVRVPVVNRFLANPWGRSQARTDFFEVYTRLEQVHNTFRDRFKIEDKGTYLREHSRDLHDARYFSFAAGKIFRAMRRQHFIAGDKKLSGREKREAMDNLDEQINGIAKRALEKRRQGKAAAARGRAGGQAATPEFQDDQPRGRARRRNILGTAMQRAAGGG